MYNSFTCHKIVFSTVRHKWVKTYVINVFFNKSNQFDLEVNGLVIDCNIVKTVDFYQGFVTKTMFEACFYNKPIFCFKKCFPKCAQNCVYCTQKIL